MANTATALTAVPMGWGHTGTGGLVVPIVVTFDTVGVDLTVYDTPTNVYCAIVGMQYGEASAHNLIIKSGSQTLVTLEMPVSTVVDDRIGDGFKCITRLGEDLIMQVTTAVISSMLVYVTEFKMFKW